MRKIVFFVLFLTFAACQQRNCNKEILNEFTAIEIDYFHEVALHREFINPEEFNLRFWTRDIRIKLKGEYTKDDSLEVIRIVEELNNLIDPIEIKIVSLMDNVEIKFIDGFEFINYGRYALGGTGYVNVYWNRFFPHGYILINKNINKIKRKHILREELTQCLGLLNDSYIYPESIFYQRRSEVTEFSEMDKRLIQMLYNYNLPYSLSRKEFEKCYMNVE